MEPRLHHRRHPQDLRGVDSADTRVWPQGGKPIIVMSFYCNFDAPGRVVHEDEKAFALKFTNLEGEPRWYLDWRRNPVLDPPDL